MGVCGGALRGDLLDDHGGGGRNQHGLQERSQEGIKVHKYLPFQMAGLSSLPAGWLVVVKLLALAASNVMPPSLWSLLQRER